MGISDYLKQQILKGVTQVINQQYTANGKLYRATEQMPLELQRLFQDQNQNQLPDLLERGSPPIGPPKVVRKFTHIGTPTAGSVHASDLIRIEQQKAKLTKLIIAGLLVLYFVLGIVLYQYFLKS